MAVTVGVVGVAGVGRAHLERVRRTPNAELVGLADVAAEPREKAAVEFGVPGYASQAELLERARPRAVILGTPPLSHRPLDILHAVDLTLLDARLLDVALVRHPVRPVLEAANRLLEALDLLLLGDVQLLLPL